MIKLNKYVFGDKNVMTSSIFDTRRNAFYDSAKDIAVHEIAHILL